VIKLKEMITKKGMTKTRKRVVKLKEDDHQEGDDQDHQEDDYHGRGRTILGRGQQTVRRTITWKGTTKTKKRVAKFKEDDH